MIKEIEYPFTGSKVRDLKVGQMVSLSGRIFTGRDRLHKHLYDGGESPVDFRDGAIYHCGPVVMRSEGSWKIIAAGPTTSIREESYMAKIIRKHHVRVIIGKGGMGEATRKACAQYGCVYLQAVGGAAALLAGAVERVSNVYFLKEFGMAEALWELDVKGLNAVVTMDAKGKSLHKRVKAVSKKALSDLLG